MLHASLLGKGVLHRILRQFCEEESLDHQPHQVTVTTGSVPLKRSPGRGSASRQSRSVFFEEEGVWEKESEEESLDQFF